MTHKNFIYKPWHSALIERLEKEMGLEQPVNTEIDATVTCVVMFLDEMGLLREPTE